MMDGVSNRGAAAEVLPRVQASGMPAADSTAVGLPSGLPVRKNDRVAIITRSKDRPLLLRRAMLSVLRQRHRNWVHVIVNDGGDPGPVDGLVRALEPDYRGRLKVIHNIESVGMEAASNIGIRATNSQYVTIHDDDDAWHPEFLSEAIAALSKGVKWGARGVVVHVERVTERIHHDRIIELHREPFNMWMESVDLARLAHSNTFPPIAFLFERATLDEIGYFDEELPVLGDWDFHLRFASRWEIALLPKTLAYYHHREQSDDSVYGNSVTAQSSRHRLYRTIVKNRILRRELESGRLSLGELMNLSEITERVGYITHVVNQNFAVRRRPFARRAISFLGRITGIRKLLKFLRRR